MPPTSSSDIRLVIPSQPEYVGVVRLAAAGIAHRLEFDVEQADDLKLAVTEACGHLLTGGESPGPIEVGWQISETSLTVVVRREQSATPPEDSDEREMGLFLIHALMDEVTELEDGYGLSMVKYIQRKPDE